MKPLSKKKWRGEDKTFLKKKKKGKLSSFWNVDQNMLSVNILKSI